MGAKRGLFLFAGILVASCSSMQPTPMMPTYPARIGGPGGVRAEEDAYCRQRAHQAAQQAKDTNVAKEIGATAIGALAGAAIGNALEPGRPHGPPPGGPGGPPPGPRPSGPHYGTAGGIAGAAVGAAASQRMIQDPQQVYDINYNNCIATYAR